jgi:hypothetical protein
VKDRHCRASDDTSLNSGRPSVLGKLMRIGLEPGPEVEGRRQKRDGTSSFRVDELNNHTKISKLK